MSRGLLFSGHSVYYVQHGQQLDKLRPKHIRITRNADRDRKPPPTPCCSPGVITISGILAAVYLIC